MSERYCTGEGPECPKCGRCFIADEGNFFDEDGFEMECDECQIKFFVQPYIKTTWRTVPIPTPEPRDEL